MAINAMLIMPTHQLPRFGRWCTGHLLLAHMILEDETYARYYRERSCVGDWVIVDNSLYELGHSLAPEELLRAAHKVHADELILPDAFKSDTGTLRAIEHFFEKVNVDELGTCGIAVVPQATNVLDWASNASEIESRFGRHIDTFCIPKHLGQNNSQIRVELAKALHDDYPRYAIHMLGCNSMAEAREIGQRPYIRSIDSSLPFIASYYDMPLKDWDLQPTAKKRPDDFFTKHEDDYHLRVTATNVLTYLRELGTIQ